MFNSLFQGSLYGQSDAQLVLVFLLTHADASGYVRIIPRGIVAPTGLSLERVTQALAILEGQDPDSRTEDMDGRRLEVIGQGGYWRIVNYLKYRKLASHKDRQEQNREAKQRQRLRESTSASVSNGQHPSAMSAQGEVEVEVDIKEKTSPDDVGAREWLQGFHEHFWPEFPLKVDKALALEAWGKIRPRNELCFNQIIDGLKPWKRHWLQPDAPKVLYAVRWLKRKRWTEAPPT